MKDGKIRLLLESPKEQFPASVLVMLYAMNVMASKKTDSMCQTTLLENMTPPQAGTSTAAKRDLTLRHHLDTRILDLATTSQTILLAKNTTMVHLVMLFARQGDP
jgi:predicted nuclease of predicted toxin-antitoxin system